MGNWSWGDSGQGLSSTLIKRVGLQCRLRVGWFAYQREDLKPMVCYLQE